ncbi:hypothetical protein Bca4012_027448 [Brassica carinata]
MLDIIEDVGDSENFLIIHNAIKKEDHAEGIKDPKELLVDTVSHLSRLAHPGVLQSILAQNLDQSNKVDWRVGTKRTVQRKGAHFYS